MQIFICFIPLDYHWITNLYQFILINTIRLPLDYYLIPFKLTTIRSKGTQGTQLKVALQTDEIDMIV